MNGVKTQSEKWQTRTTTTTTKLKTGRSADHPLATLAHTRKTHESTIANAVRGLTRTAQIGRYSVRPPDESVSHTRISHITRSIPRRRETEANHSRDCDTTTLKTFPARKLGDEAKARPTTRISDAHDRRYACAHSKMRTSGEDIHLPIGIVYLTPNSIYSPYSGTNAHTRAPKTCQPYKENRKTTTPNTRTISNPPIHSSFHREGRIFSLLVSPLRRDTSCKYHHPKSQGTPFHIHTLTHTTQSRPSFPPNTTTTTISMHSAGSTEFRKAGPPYPPTPTTGHWNKYLVASIAKQMF